ncbi:MAG: hypothetical protein AB7V32_06315 [Candidatus Berkiella sp.]
MSLTGVEKFRYAELAKDILDKILITGKRGFSLVIYALKTTVLRERAKKAMKIPLAILEKVGQLRELINNKNSWVPMDKKLRANPRYRKNKMKQRQQFVHLVEDVTKDKIRELRFMSGNDRRNLIITNREKLLQLAHDQQVRRDLEARRQARMAQSMPDEAMPKEDESLERIQWRVRLLEPMQQDGYIPVQLSEDEVARLAYMRDRDRIPELQCMALQDDLFLAKWLASVEIYGLIMNQKLIATDEHHFALLFSPTENQMRRLSLLCPFISQDILTVEAALEAYLDETCYTLLDNPEFKTRAINLAFNDEDVPILSLMGIELPCRRNSMNQFNL